MNNYHKTVLLQEIIENLNIKPGYKYIDATLGGGGHTSAILDRGGIVLGIDTDQDALDYVKANVQISTFNSQLKSVKGNFKDIKTIARQNGFEKVSGIIFDLGVSSHQFDIAERGFSFTHEGPLDMRMDRNLEVQAKDLINALTKGELIGLFTKLGEEKYAKIIAEHIIASRQIRSIETTTQLAEIVKRTVHSREEINPSTRIFQALRIAINDELNVLKEALPQALELLEPGGRIAIISFHSLEDRIVKREFLKQAEAGVGYILTKKPIVPGEQEISQNKRSRSAKFRVFEKK